LCPSWLCFCTAFRSGVQWAGAERPDRVDDLVCNSGATCANRPGSLHLLEGGRRAGPRAGRAGWRRRARASPGVCQSSDLGGLGPSSTGLALVRFQRVHELPRFGPCGSRSREDSSGETTWSVTHARTAVWAPRAQRSSARPRSGSGPHRWRGRLRTSSCGPAVSTVRSARRWQGSRRGSLRPCSDCPRLRLASRS